MLCSSQEVAFKVSRLVERTVHWCSWSVKNTYQDYVVKLMRVLTVVAVGLLVSLATKTVVAAPVNCVDEAATGVPQIECQALGVLYDETDGNNWTVNDAWKTDAPVSDWYGVVVSGGHVIKIDLKENNLVGSIPVRLEDLASLRELRIALNLLSGSIPKGLGKLSNLTTLSLYSNALDGSIPQELGSLSNLQSLELGINELTGVIPFELGALSNLRYMYLHKNQLEGSIPSEIGGMNDLYILWLHNNMLTGTIPVEIGNLGALNELSLGDNHFTGSIPPQLGQLTALTRFQLENNNLEGALPDALSQMPPSTLFFHVEGNHLDADAQGNAIISSALRSWYDSIPAEDNNKNISRQTPPPQSGVNIAPIADLITTEDGGIDSFSVALNKIPTHEVTVAFVSSDISEGSVSPVSLTFTPATWFMEQVVTLTGEDDAIVDGNKNYAIASSVTSSDVNYNGIATNRVDAMNVDDDQYGVTVSPVDGLMTTEEGGAAIFRVLLNAQPDADVIVGLTSTDVSEGTVDPGSLVFTSSNWNVQQNAAITGVNDNLDDGNQGYTIQTDVTSSDQNYDGIESANVNVTNIDNDSAGVTISPTSGLVTTEDGGMATFRAQLNTRPTAEVSIALTSSDESEGIVAPVSLVFGIENWAEPQITALTGMSDSLIDGDIAYSITSVATSEDASYDGIAINGVSAINVDTDAAGVTVYPVAGLATNEDGGVAIFNLFLSTQPGFDVMIKLSSSDETEGTVHPTLVRFTPQDWNNPITVTITGQDDDAFDHDQHYFVQIDSTKSDDHDYDDIDLPDVTVINKDNETCSSPPDDVIIAFSSFSTSSDPYVCIANEGLASPSGGQPLTVEQGAEVRIYSPIVVLDTLFKVEDGGVMKVSPNVP